MKFKTTSDRANLNYWQEEDKWEQLALPARKKYYKWLNLQPGLVILEVGCGSGRNLVDMSKFIQPNGKIVGLDIAKAHVKAAQELVNQSQYKELIEVYLGDINEFSDKPIYDLIWIKNTLHHLPDPLQSLKQIVSLLKTGGRVAVLEDAECYWLPFDLVSGKNDKIYLYYRIAVLKYYNQLQISKREKPKTVRYNTTLLGLFQKLKLKQIQLKTVTINEVPPLSEPMKAILELYLKNPPLERLIKYLPKDVYRNLEPLWDKSAPTYLLKRKDLYIRKSYTCLVASNPKL
ncbi:MAG: class I SAM-dependent methyltransferase [Candidatus Hermodarchaeota archaeon]